MSRLKKKRRPPYRLLIVSGVIAAIFALVDLGPDLDRLDAEILSGDAGAHGQEGTYRYQEDQMEDMFRAVRAFRARLSSPLEEAS